MTTSPAPDDPDLIAAEYVLGTLEAAERANAERRRTQDPGFDRAVAAWESRLSPLLDLAGDVTPPPSVYTNLLLRLPPQERAAPGLAGGASVSDDSPFLGQSNVIRLQRSLRVWKTSAIAATALAASLAMAIGVRELTQSRGPVGTAANFVAVLQKDAASPAFILSVDLETKSVTVRPVAAQPEPGKAYELWLVDASLGTPKSLGLIGDKPYSTAKGLPYTSQIVQNATYAVSIEPPGGSPIGVPTGPVVYAGKLIQTTP